MKQILSTKFPKIQYLKITTFTMCVYAY